MTRIILIDGENLIYGLRTLLGTEKKIAPREKLLGFNFRGLLDEVLEDEEKAQILYFGAKLRQYDQTPELLKKTKAVIAWQSRLMNTLQSQGVQFIKVGNLRARETNPCPGCGHHEWHMLEKGVDVGLAVRLVTEAKKNAEIVLISSDTDLLPAIREAKKRGARLIYVGYENRLVVSIVRNTRLTRVITATMVKKYLQESK